MSLVLGTKVGQTIYIDGPCAITLVETRNGYVRLAFDAPEATHIKRTNAKVLTEKVKVDINGQPKGDNK